LDLINYRPVEVVLGGILWGNVGEEPAFAEEEAALEVEAEAEVEVEMQQALRGEPILEDTCMGAIDAAVVANMEAMGEVVVVPVVVSSLGCPVVQPSIP
jgi:hypothetical protein